LDEIPIRPITTFDEVPPPLRKTNAAQPVARQDNILPKSLWC